MQQDLSALEASFVTQYYEGILLQPRDLGACYGPDSTMNISYADGATIVATGHDDIERQVLALSEELNAEGNKLQITHTEIYPSFDNSSVLTLDGVVLSPDSYKEFSHTVVLRNNGVEDEFYIRNDIWRFAAETSFVQLPPVAPVAEAPVEEEVEQEEEEVAEEEAPHHETNGHHVEAEAEEEEEAAEEEDEEVAEEEDADEEESVAEQSVKSSHKTQSATPSEADNTEVTPPKKEAPKGPMSWAKLASAKPANKDAPPPQRVAVPQRPQRVSPPPAKSKEDEKKEAEKKKKDDEKNAKDKYYNEERAKRQSAKAFLTLKMRDVDDETILSLIPEKLQPALVSLRNLSEEKGRVFLDFTDTNALEVLKADPNFKLGGKPIPCEPQKKR